MTSYHVAISVSKNPYMVFGCPHEMNKGWACPKNAGIYKMFFGQDPPVDAHKKVPETLFEQVIKSRSGEAQVLRKKLDHLREEGLVK